MKTLLVSFFGSSNLGDLLISSGLKSEVEKYSEVVSVDYLGNNIVENMDIEDHTGYIQTPKKSSTRKMIKNVTKISPLNHFAMRAKRRMNLFSFPTFDQELEQVKALIIGGGNMIFDLETDTISAKRFDYYVTKAKEKKLPVFAISLGIGPFQNKYQQKYAVEALSKCDYITFRDNKSLELFKEFNPTKKNVTVVPDPVFFMEKRENGIPNGKIGLNIINPELFPEDLKAAEIKQGYVQLIDELLKTTEEEILIFNTETKDYPFCQEVFDLLNNKERVQMTKVNNLEELYHVFNQVKLVVGTRMHSLITSFSQGIPIVGLSWQQKVDAMFELIDDSESVFSLNNLSTNIQPIVAQASKKLAHPNENYQQVMENLEEKAQINEDFLQGIFNNTEN